MTHNLGMWASIPLLWSIQELLSEEGSRQWMWGGSRWAVRLEARFMGSLELGAGLEALCFWGMDRDHGGGRGCGVGSEFG